MSVFAWTLMLLLFLILMLVIRNEVAGRIQFEAIDKVFDGSPGWEARKEIYERRSYDGILFDLTCWTAKQAHPELFAQIEGTKKRPPASATPK